MHLAAFGSPNVHSFAILSPLETHNDHLFNLSTSRLRFLLLNTNPLRVLTSWRADLELLIKGSAGEAWWVLMWL